MSRLFTVTFALFCAFILFAAPASAGGWATITFDPLPTEIQAGKPVLVRFLVKQHGNTAVHSAFGEPLVAMVQFRITPDGKSSSVEATPDKEVGYYVATITFPEQGNYEVMVMTNALDTSEVAPNPLSVSVSAAAEPIADSPMQKGNTATEPLVAGATATAPTSLSPITIFLGIGVLLLLGAGALAILRTR